MEKAPNLSSRLWGWGVAEVSLETLAQNNPHNTEAPLGVTCSEPLQKL